MTLADVRLIDLSHGIAGAYLGRLFADAGADVIRIEPEDGARLRRRSGRPLGEGESGALFRFLAAGTRSVVGDPSEVEVDRLLAGSSAVVVDGATPSAANCA